jgi:hypothetical protein
MDLAFHSDAASLVWIDLVVACNSIVVVDLYSSAVSDAPNVDEFALTPQFHPESFSNF